MYSSTEAIALQLHPYKDNSAVVKLYTRQTGLISCWVRSIRSKNSKIRPALMQPLSVINAEISYRQSNNMAILKEISVAIPTQNIQMTIEKRAIALFICELLLHTLKEAPPDTPLYDFIRTSVHLLNCTDKPCVNFHILFLIRLYGYLGFSPRGIPCTETPYFDLQEGLFTTKEPLHPYFILLPTNEHLDLFFNLTMGHFYETPLCAATRKKLLNGLLDYYRLHLGISALKSHLVLHEVMQQC